MVTDPANHRMTDEERARVTRNYPIIRFFQYNHLPPHLQSVSQMFAEVAWMMAVAPRSAETSAGLRKLLEAKDCAVRSALIVEDPLTVN